jgi:hypothetical protein
MKNEKLLNEISFESINKSSWLNKKISEIEKEH